MASGPSLTIHCPACGASNRLPLTRLHDNANCGSCHVPLPTAFSTPMTLDETSFDPFLTQEKGLVLAEFWAAW